MNINDTISFNGRNITVTDIFPIQANTAAACPWLAGQYAVTGGRGATGLLQTFKNGGLRRVLWLTRTGTTRTENEQP